MRRLLHPRIDKIENFLLRPSIELASLEAAVKSILLDVRQDGDEAVMRYTKLFDKCEPKSVLLDAATWASQAALCPSDLKGAIDKAAENIRAFHEAQQEVSKVIETTPGVRCWRKSVAIDKVGLYIPGGTAPLFSSVLMLAIPAQIAGCKQLVLCTPPSSDGLIHPAIAYAAQISGVHRVCLAGGVQAIGALAYGTESVPQVNKIFGPGNQYVTMAKRLVSQESVAIDMPAGPSEVLVYADASANPAFVAADLLSQAEHGIDSQVVLITDTEAVLDRVEEELEKQLNLLSRKHIAEQALENSRAVVVESRADAIEIINIYAPEHLILSIDNYDAVLDQISNAGSVFLGNYTPESAGDYASGTNHTLPTNGHARAFSGVSLDSFVKKITFQEISPNGLRALGPVIEIMAAAEQLDAHKNAVSIRLSTL